MDDSKKKHKLHKNEYILKLLLKVICYNKTRTYTGKKEVVQKFHIETEANETIRSYFTFYWFLVLPISILTFLCSDFSSHSSIPLQLFVSSVLFTFYLF